MSKNITTKSKNATKIRKNATKTTKKCGQCPKNAFNASILFQKSSECKKCFFNAGTIARCLVRNHLHLHFVRVKVAFRSKSFKVCAHSLKLVTVQPFIMNFHYTFIFILFYYKHILF